MYSFEIQNQSKNREKECGFTPVVSFPECQPTSRAGPVQSKETGALFTSPVWEEEPSQLCHLLLLLQAH